MKIEEYITPYVFLKNFGKIYLRSLDGVLKKRPFSEDASIYTWDDTRFCKCTITAEGCDIPLITIVNQRIKLPAGGIDFYTEYWNVRMTIKECILEG